MRFISHIQKVSAMLWAFIKKLFLALYRRRFHVWSAFYYIGVWNLLEPMNELFGFSPQTIEIIKHIGVAAIPLFIILVWFHGEAGPQKFVKSEAAALSVGAAIAVFIFYTLTKTPPPAYAIVAPISGPARVWFEETLLKEFERENHVRISVHTFESEYESNLRPFLSAPDTLHTLLVKIPLHYTGVFWQSDHQLLAPLAEQAASDGWSELDEHALQFGIHHAGDGKLYYLPAEYECNVLVYLTPRVEEAVAGWRRYQSAIDSTFFDLCGRHLPKDYVLEPDPNQWDTLDLLAASWFWANHSQAAPALPRFAFTGAKSYEMFSVLLDRALCQGASLEQALAAPLNLDLHPLDPVAELFYWDALFARAGLFYKGIWLGEGMRVSEIVAAIQARAVYLAILPSRSLGELAAVPDLGVATLPAGVSFTGAPVSKSGFSNIWFWAIPKTSPSYDLSQRLAKSLVSKQSQLRMREKLSSIPTHRQLLDGTAVSDDEIWAAVLEQIQLNQKNVIVPVNPYKDSREIDYQILIKFFHQKWGDVVKSQRRLDLDHIKGMLMLPIVSP
jgi:maltose-binding protein MalE